MPPAHFGKPADTIGYCLQDTAQRTGNQHTNHYAGITLHQQAQKAKRPGP
ncbi:MAG: hypothetical protein ABIL58_07785 [Pseudomonadota bacterium]